MSAEKPLEQKAAEAEKKRWKVAPKRTGSSPEAVVQADNESDALAEYVKRFPRAKPESLTVKLVG